MLNLRGRALLPCRALLWPVRNLERMRRATRLVSWPISLAFAKQREDDPGLVGPICCPCRQASYAGNSYPMRASISQVVFTAARAIMRWKCAWSAGNSRGSGCSELKNRQYKRNR